MRRLALLALVACKGDSRGSEQARGSAPPPPAADAALAMPVDARTRPTPRNDYDGLPLLVVDGLPGGIRLIANYAGPLPDSSEPLLPKLASAYLIARRLTSGLDPALERLRGQRLDLHDDKGVACTVTVDDVYRVKMGQYWGSLRDTDPQKLAAILWPPPPPVGDPKRERDVWGEFAGLSIMEEQPCAGAMFATRAGAKVVTAKLKKGDAIEAAVTDAFAKTDLARMIEEKDLLEHVGGWRTISTRILDGGTGPVLVLLYLKIRDDRSIAIFTMARDSEPPPLAYIDTVAATAPSRVIGVDIDGNGAMDAVVAHGKGAAIIMNGQTGIEYDSKSFDVCAVTVLGDGSFSCANHDPVAASRLYGTPL